MAIGKPATKQGIVRKRQATRESARQRNEERKRRLGIIDGERPNQTPVAKE